MDASPDAFENFLDPLQKLLRLSPLVASTLAHPDLFSRTALKLNTKKAVVRLNLLRIIRSICDASEDHGGASLIQKFGLYEAVERLADSDQAILVREMASDLIKSSDLSSRRSYESTTGLRPHPRRSSSATMTPPSQQLKGVQASAPGTPQHLRSAQKSYFDSSSSGLYEGSRAPRMSSTTALTPSTFRPTSRDGSSGSTAGSSSATSIASAAWSGSTGSAKSRLPRTNTAPFRASGAPSSGPRLTRLSLASQRKEENVSPIHTPAAAAAAAANGRTGSALNPGRRRRVTSSGTGTAFGQR